MVMDLTGLSDKAFRDLVDQELRKEHPQTSPGDRERLNEVSAQFRSAENIHRWVAVLEIMKSSSETQLGAKLAEIKKTHGTVSQSEYETRLRQYQGWKAGNVRFLHSVQQRLLEARELRIRQFGIMYPSRIVEERNLASRSLLELVRAVTIHRETVLAEYDPTEADETLWEAVPHTA